MEKRDGVFVIFGAGIVSYSADDFNGVFPRWVFSGGGVYVGGRLWVVFGRCEVQAVLGLWGSQLGLVVLF